MLLPTLVLSQLDYVNSTLSREPISTVKPYQKIQNFAARVVYKKSRRDEVYTCLQELHWVPVKYRTIFKVLTIVCNTLHGKTSQYLREKLKQKHFPGTTRQSTSSGIILNIPFNKKKSFADRGFSYTVAKHWNDLPEHTKKAKDIKTFKSLLKHISLN